MAAAALACAAPALAETPGTSPVSVRVEGGHQVLDLDVAALTDAHRRAPAAGTSARVDPPSPAPTAAPRPKRFAHKAGQYDDAPLAALLTTSVN